MLVRALQRNWTNQIRVHAEQISFKEQALVMEESGEAQMCRLEAQEALMLNARSLPTGATIVAPTAWYSLL